MKKLFFTIVFIFTIAANAQAERVITLNKGITGLLLGAGGGALAGQAIGRDTESTVIGTTIGTLVGYMVGNEMDKGQGREMAGVSHRPLAQPVYRQPVYHEPVPAYRYQPEPVEYRPRSPYAECREVEILGTVGGRPERLLTTACKTTDGWVLVDAPDAVHPDPARYQPRYEYDPYRPVYGGHTQRIRYPY